MACLQNETAPEKCLSRYETCFEKGKDPKNDPKRLPKDPSVLKIVWRANSLRREKNATDSAQKCLFF